MSLTDALLACAPALACFFWMLTLAVDAAHATRARRMLTVFMAVATVHFLGQTIYCCHDYALTAAYDPIYTLATVLVFPLYYLYIRTLTDPQRLTFRSLWVLVPSFAIFTVYLALFLAMSGAEREAFAAQRLYGEPGGAVFTPVMRLQAANVTLLGVVFDVQIPLVLFFGARHLLRYYRRLKESYSDPDERMIAPVKRLLIWFVITSISSIGFNSIGRAFFTQNGLGLLVFASAGFVTLLYAVGYAGFRQYFSVDDLPTDASDDASDVPAVAPAPRNGELRGRFIALMEEGELFRRPGLKITDVADMMNSNRAYVSAMVNHDMQTTFSDLVNGYRVEYAKRLITSGRVPLREVIEASGFSGESSFYRTFRQFEGCTPRAWMNRNKHSG